MIVKRFEFQHATASMSALVRDQNGVVHAFVKGSFERIQDLSSPENQPEVPRASQDRVRRTKQKQKKRQKFVCTGPTYNDPPNAPIL